MKKMLSISLTVVILVVLLLPVQGFALDNKELEKAITTAKTLLEISDDYDTFNYSWSKEGTRTIYHLSWRDSKNKLGEVSVGIDTTGAIWDYWSYKPYDSQSHAKLPSVSKSDALKTADAFIAKVNPAISNKIKYQDNNSTMYVYDTSYYFNYVRTENSIPYPANYVNVNVDNRTGKVQGYSCMWTDGLVFPSTDGILSSEKAKQVFKDNLGLKLIYKLSYSTKEVKPYLAYDYVYSNRSIDAKTGEVITINNIYYSNGAMGSASTADKAAMENQVVITPEERDAIENTANLISETEAEKIGRSVLQLDSSYKLNSINLYSDWMNKNEYQWSMSFTKEVKTGEKPLYYSANITINAATRDVLNFYRYTDNSSNTNVKYNEAQSLKIAQDFIKSMQLQKSKEVEKLDWDNNNIIPYPGTEKPSRYFFTFTRKSNGVYFPGNGFSLTVDAITGNVVDYSYNWYKGNLPAADKIITLDQAHKVLFDSIGLGLQYLADYSKTADQKVILPVPANQATPDVKLVYAINQGKPINIDAADGKLLDESGNPYIERKAPEYTDINGCSAENQIKVLAQFGIYLPGTQFKPNDSITQKDFLYLLVNAIEPYMNYQLSGSDKEDVLYNYLTSNSIIKDGEKSPTASVTRQDAAKFIIRALKYDNIAEIKGIFTLPFKDNGSINENLYGYAALAYGLNILTADDGYFKPAADMTRAGAIIAIYNLLNMK